MKENKQVSEYIESAPPVFKEIMAQLRKLIHDTVPDVTEEFKWSQPVFKKNKDFCYLKLTKNHVNLGFLNAEILDDPDLLLEGTGKQMRHVKLKTLSDVKSQLFKKWFKISAS